MERTMSAEERIRRAEEIYNKRRINKDIRVSTRNVNSNPKIEYRMFKKLILQIIICLLIYFIFYLIKNSNYIFSEDVINKTRQFLSYDINFQNIYYNIEEYYKNNIKPIISNESEEQVNQMANEEIQNVVEENVNIESVNQEIKNSQVQGGIGGGEENNLINNEIIEVSADEEQINESEKKELTQMEIDANEIKEKYSFVLPLRGTISSRFGPREKTEIVSANHAGIDIAVNEGTIFVASMEGKVTTVSSQGGYGNHVYIEKDDVVTLYAHCKTIYVKEGDIIMQGQQIGEVGETGNATGPHLHFEVRKQNRVVNPEYILDFV